MSPELQAVLVDALRAARPAVDEAVRGLLNASCAIDRATGDPIRATVEENDRSWVEQHEALLAQIDAAIAAAESVH